MAEGATDVFVQIRGEDVHAGRLWSHRRRGVESATFSYLEEYISRADAYALDPALPLASGQFQTRLGQELFGAFTDCAPDRWGRRLINRARRRRDNAAPSIGEVDYLLGVRDDMRQGALRFRARTGGPFLAPEESRIPPLVDLPRLLNASARLERDQASDEELRLLLRGGSSLGGARPKAHVIDPRGRPSIAKFPSSTDDWDVVAWEAVAHELATRAGIKVPSAELHWIEGKSVFISERFDRSAAGERIGYVSAMTMLEAGDRDPRSYLEIAEVIESESPHATEDLRELWSRIGLFILISNTDDHLRNHGFLRTVTAGWGLAPAFDINPNPQAAVGEFATPINDESERTIDVLIEVADYFRIREDQARLILVNLGEVTSQWRTVAAGFGLGKDAMEEMAPAFENHQCTAVRALGRRTSPSASSATSSGT